MKRDQGVGSTITQTLRDPSLNIQNNVKLFKPNDPKVVNRISQKCGTINEPKVLNKINLKC